MMTNRKSIPAIFLTVLFTLFIVVGIPAISMSSEATTGNDPTEVKEDKQIKPDKEVKQEKQEQKVQETKPKFKMGKEVKEQKNPYASAKISIKITPSTKKTFGYDILLNGKPLMHQPNIPGLPGNEGFTTRERAQKVAEFVVKKIRKNEMPPMVTIDDLNNMGVIN
jgi:outer membrane biosynthesis protein TonB